MKLTVLVDNNTFIDKYYYGEPAVCYYIECDNKKILFDVGYSNIFLKNAKLMNIDLNNIDAIVISHGHNDHTGGLRYINNSSIKLYAHPLAFNKRFESNEDIGSYYSEYELSNLFELNLSGGVIHITENLIFLGSIPDVLDFEKRIDIGEIEVDGIIIKDYVLDDSALVYNTLDGIFIITGCSHSGICNIIDYAKKVCNNDTVLGVIGGFHLMEDNERLDKTIKYFKDNNINKIYPSHCTSLVAKHKFMNELDNVYEVGVGLVIEIN